MLFGKSWLFKLIYVGFISNSPALNTLAEKRQREKTWSMQFKAQQEQHYRAHKEDRLKQSGTLTCGLKHVYVCECVRGQLHGWPVTESTVRAGW